jgi:DNA-binding LytR/AlgR family response regulator
LFTFGQKYQTFDMKILIVEDDPLVADDLKDKLEQLQYRVTGVAESYDMALESIRTNKPDLALLDIELKGNLTGIDLSEQLNQQGIPFIYLSSIQDLNTYFKAKDTGPLKNLPKPIDLVNLRNALLDSETQLAASPKQAVMHFFTDKDGIRKRIDPDQIVYLDAGRSYCDVYFSDNTRSTLSTAMGNVVKKLNHLDLIRIHRSVYINRKHIQLIRGNEVKLTVGDFLKISDTYRDGFNGMVNVL